MKKTLKNLLHTAEDTLNFGWALGELVSEQFTALEPIEYDLTMKPDSPAYRDMALRIYEIMWGEVYCSQKPMKPPITLLTSGKLWDEGQTKGSSRFADSTVFWILGRGFAQVEKRGIDLRVSSDPYTAEIALHNWVESYFHHSNSIPWCTSSPHISMVDGQKGVRITEVKDSGWKDLYSWYDV